MYLLIFLDNWPLGLIIDLWTWWSSWMINLWTWWALWISVWLAWRTYWSIGESTFLIFLEWSISRFDDLLGSVLQLHNRALIKRILDFKSFRALGSKIWELQNFSFQTMSASVFWNLKKCLIFQTFNFFKRW